MIENDLLVRLLFILEKLSCIIIGGMFLNWSSSYVTPIPAYLVVVGFIPELEDTFEEVLI